MRSISQPFLRRPVLTVVCSLLILLAGCTALFGLGLEDLPPLAPTRVSVSASFPAASPEVVEQSVTRVLEQQLNGLEGVESISSTSRQGGASWQILATSLLPAAQPATKLGHSRNLSLPYSCQF